MPKRKSDDEENGSKASKKLKTVKYGQIMSLYQNNTTNYSILNIGFNFFIVNFIN